MFIKGKEFDEELVIEIGKFAVLWNMFEKEHCETNCNPRKIRAAAPELSIDQDKQKALVEVLISRKAPYLHSVAVNLPRFVRKILYIAELSTF